MATRINIDPVTRIEGHLRVDVEVDGGSVSKAWASCTMWRGIENICAGTRPARSLALHPALLRRLHHGARHGERARRGRRAEAADSAQRAVHPQPDPDQPRAARSHRALLPALGARLGRYHDHSAAPIREGRLRWRESLSNWTGNSRKRLQVAQDKSQGAVPPAVSSACLPAATGDIRRCICRRT